MFLGMFAEVSNTYKESYFYHVKANQKAAKLQVSKRFHVSPFFDEEGDYIFTLNDTSTRCDIHIAYEINEKKYFMQIFVIKNTL